MAINADAADVASVGAEGRAVRTGGRWSQERRRYDVAMRYLFLGSAVLVSVVIISIIVFLALQGFKTFGGTSLRGFFANGTWLPEHNTFGASPFIVGTLEVTLISVIISGPFAVGGAVFMAKVAPNWMREIMRPASDLFVGIPSVVYGFIALTTVTPWLGSHYGGTGYGLLAAGLVLAVMILPTILSVAEDAIRSLPGSIEEASYALGATRWQTIRRILLPAALPGLLTAVVLGMGRALGETMAISLVIGNNPQIVNSLVKPTATLTTEIATEMGNTAYNTTWNDALFLMALVLLVLSMGLILLIRLIGRRRVA